MARLASKPLETPSKPKGGRPETRVRLLEAAKEIFEEIGFLNARVADIAKRAGASHGLFYNYFDSKQDIFREIAYDIDRKLVRAIDQTPTPGHPEVTWMSAIRFFFEVFRREAKILRVIEEVSHYDPEIHIRRRGLHQKEGKRVAKAIAALQAEGRADPNLEPEIAASAVSALIWRFCEQWFIWGELDCTFDEGVAQYARIMMNALQFKSAADRD